MRHINRLDKPQRLVDNEEVWTERFIASGKDRPSSAQYGHKDVKETLARSSFYKCFYSEVMFNDLSEAQVDHYVEVSEDPSKAFEWENLYLSHKDSNVGKITNRALPNKDCLDPCTATDAEIEEHLYFENELIYGTTEVGRNTIQKYHLNKSIYNVLRTRELQLFNDIVYKIAFHKLTLTDELKEKLIRFSNPDRPFSLMFKKLLVENNLM